MQKLSHMQKKNYNCNPSRYTCENSKEFKKYC